MGCSQFVFQEHGPRSWHGEHHQHLLWQARQDEELQRSSRINSPPWVIYNLAGDETSSRAGKRAAKSPWAWDSPGKERLGVRRMLVGMKFLPGEDATSHPCCDASDLPVLVLSVNS